MINALVHPNSKNPRVEKDLFGGLHVYVNAPPLENRANFAAINMLAEYFKVAKSRVKLVHGAKSKKKVFEII